MFGWLFLGTMTDFFYKPSVLPKEILTPYHKKKKNSRTKGCKMIRGKMIECKCAVCGEKFTARVADRNRGWAKCCSKSCAATLSNKKTGKYRKHLACQNKMDNLGYEDVDYYDDSHLFGDEQ